MSVSFLGLLFSQPDKTGASQLVGVGRNDRYTHLTAAQLQGTGLYTHVQSVELFSSAVADANVVLLKNDDCSGPFVQLSSARGAGTTYWNTSGHIASAVMIAGHKTGANETRISLRDQFLGEWNTFLDARLNGSRASRQGDPLLTWEAFPQAVSSLDPNLVYIKIQQGLHIHMPWYWSDYSASMTYHVYLYVDGDRHVRAAGARWAWWVESGAKSHKIGDQLGPQVSSGLPELEHQLNQKLMLADLLGPVSDVYYLPGRQLTPVGSGAVIGNTQDDVTIVIER